jgi:hypothetical protein
LKWDEKPLHEAIFNRQDEENLSSTSMRFIEAVTAFTLGIPYDERWFEIPLKSRTYMVATRLGKEWMNNLQEEYAANKVRK